MFPYSGKSPPNRGGITQPCEDSSSNNCKETFTVVTVGDQNTQREHGFSGFAAYFVHVCPKANPIRDSDTQNNHLLDPLDARMRGERAIGLDLGRLTTISLVIAWFNLRLLMDAPLPTQRYGQVQKECCQCRKQGPACKQLSSAYNNNNNNNKDLSAVVRKQSMTRSNDSEAL